MASKSETGHAKNVANFESLISFCVGYGVKYNPSNPNLQVLALQSQLASTQANISSVQTTSVDFNNAVNARIIAFNGLKTLSTQLVNALDSTGATPEIVKNAKSVNAKIQGTKMTKADSGKSTKADAGIIEEPIDPTAPVIDTVKTISSAQLSYTNLVEHFTKMVTILSTEPAYVPNEIELQVATLNTLATTLKNTNTGVINAYTTVSNSRIARNQSLYNPTNGLCQIAKEVKLYVKSIFKASSPQFKQVSAIEFKTVKD